MKKAILLCLTLMAATFGFAQQQLATLNHNDSITVYYGASALQSAHAAAVNGDIITLSPGSFNSVTITKAVTIRGAGMMIDTVSGTVPTLIINNLTINVANDALHHLTIEGVQFACEYVYYQTAYRPQFIKCHFRNLCHSGSNSTMVDAHFINCIIEYFDNNGSSVTNAVARNTNFINSAILDGMYVYYGSPQFLNSIVKLDHRYVHNVSAVNSILFINYCNNPSPNAYSCYNSIGINTCGNYNYFNTTGTTGHYLYNFHSYATVFKTFRGTYGDGITFELQDSIAATCLGNDGTQVGIYGGTMHFDPRVSGLNIRRLNVAQRTTADGKLPVDIEVVSDEAATGEDNE